SARAVLEAHCVRGRRIRYAARVNMCAVALSRPRPTITFNRPRQDFGEPRSELLRIDWRNLGRVSQQRASLADFGPIQLGGWRLPLFFLVGHGTYRAFALRSKVNVRGACIKPLFDALARSTNSQKHFVVFARKTFCTLCSRNEDANNDGRQDQAFPHRLRSGSATWS